MEIFIDSSALFGWCDRSSEENGPIHSFIIERKSPLISTNFIFAETLSLVTKRVGKAKGIEIGKIILSSKIIRLMYLDEKMQMEAWNLYQKYKEPLAKLTNRGDFF